LTQKNTDKAKKSVLTRRNFLKVGGLATAAGAVVLLAGQPSLPARAQGSEKKYYDNFPPAEQMEKRWAMLIDLEKCIGCHTCAVACWKENNVPLNTYWSWVKVVETGTYPNVKVSSLPRLCNHCDNPPCVTVCPVKATYKNQDGAVIIDHSICIGCGYCIQSCPYDARSVDPNVHMAVKCTFCTHRIAKGLTPSCVDACPTNARVFGDLNDPKSMIAKIVNSRSTQVLKPEKGTRPMVFYISLPDSIAGRIESDVKVLRGA
jgi:tetrathionate reductase subunit B